MLPSPPHSIRSIRLPTHSLHEIFSRLGGGDKASGASRWVETQTPEGKPYFYNSDTRETSWELPLADAFTAGGGGEDGQTESTKVVASYLEIYNEKVRDLLVPGAADPSLLEDDAKGGGGSGGGGPDLRIREHPKTGPFVEGLTECVVKDAAGAMEHLIRGNGARRTAATNMNERSSRSHAIFLIGITQTRIGEDKQGGMSATDRSSKVALVDLAGSERVEKSGAKGKRLVEASNINKSLSALGLCIQTLADVATLAAEAAAAELAGGGGKGGKGASKEVPHIPYRNSVLTYLLKESLGGNAMTAMIATIGPAGMNHPETMSTLRYAECAKRIQNRAVVNEDPNLRVIRQLRQEIVKLRAALAQQGMGGGAAAGGPPPSLDPPPPTVVVQIKEVEVVRYVENPETRRLLAALRIQSFLRANRIRRLRERAALGLGVGSALGGGGVTDPDVVECDIERAMRALADAESMARGANTCTSEERELWGSGGGEGRGGGERLERRRESSPCGPVGLEMPPSDEDDELLDGSADGLVLLGPRLPGEEEGEEREGCHERSASMVSVAEYGEAAGDEEGEVGGG